MEHIMKLQPEFYDYILKGTKRIEIRLNDEKRKNIRANDIIVFQKEPDLKYSFKTRVVELNKYNSFDEMFNNYDISEMADVSFTKEELIKELEKFYTKEKQNIYGVLAIKIELI